MRDALIVLNGRRVLPAAEQAVLPHERMRGLLGRDSLPEGYALVFLSCPRIHCKGMRIPIDVVSLSHDGEVLDAREVKPGETGPKVPGCAAVIEMAAGRAAAEGFAPGKRVRMSFSKKRKG